MLVVATWYSTPFRRLPMLFASSLCLLLSPLYSVGYSSRIVAMAAGSLFLDTFNASPTSAFKCSRLHCLPSVPSFCRLISIFLCGEFDKTWIGAQPHCPIWSLAFSLFPALHHRELPLLSNGPNPGPTPRTTCRERDLDGCSAEEQRKKLEGRRRAARRRRKSSAADLECGGRHSGLARPRLYGAPWRSCFVISFSRSTLRYGSTALL